MIISEAASMFFSSASSNGGAFYVGIGSFDSATVPVIAGRSELGGRSVNGQWISGWVTAVRRAGEGTYARVWS